MKLTQLLITLAKIVASAAIIGYLFYAAVNGRDGRAALVEVLQQPKAWGLLVAGFLVLLTAIVITLVRWCFLVRP